MFNLRLFLQFPEWLYDCAPQADVDCYVHLIHLIPAYEIPDESRKKFFHDLLMSREEFGLVTRKKLPDVSFHGWKEDASLRKINRRKRFQVCQFPVFTDLGQVNVSIKVNVVVARFTNEQIEKLFSFHRFLFLDVLRVVKGFMISDCSHKENSYFVVPLTTNSEYLRFTFHFLRSLNNSNVARR